jgi:hypothetical protein
MKHDEWALTKELGELRKYGLYLQAERTNKEKKNDRYNIVFQESREIVEFNSTIEEVIGIKTALEICIKKIKGIKDG